MPLDNQAHQQMTSHFQLSLQMQRFTHHRLCQAYSQIYGCMPDLVTHATNATVVKRGNLLINQSKNDVRTTLLT